MEEIASAKNKFARPRNRGKGALVLVTAALRLPTGLGLTTEEALEALGK